MEPLGMSQKTLEGEKCVTSSLVCLAIKGIARGLEAHSGDDSAAPETVHASKALLQDHKERWNWKANKFSATVVRGRDNRQVGIHSAFLIATFLDPRTHRHIKLLTRVDQRSLQLEVHRVMMNRLAEEDEAEEEEPPPADAGDQAINPLLAFLGVDEAGNEPMEVVGGAISNKVKCDDEMRRFIAHLSQNSMQLIGADGNWNDPLAWWKINEISFPTLAKFAKVHLAIPATSAPSERIFSKAGQVIDQCRSSLNPENASMLIHVKSHLQKQMKKEEENL